MLYIFVIHGHSKNYSFHYQSMQQLIYCILTVKSCCVLGGGLFIGLLGWLGLSHCKHVPLRDLLFQSGKFGDPCVPDSLLLYCVRHEKPEQKSIAC